LRSFGAYNYGRIYTQACCAKGAPLPGLLQHFAPNGAGFFIYYTQSNANNAFGCAGEAFYS